MATVTVPLQDETATAAGKQTIDAAGGRIHDAVKEVYSNANPDEIAKAQVE